MIFDKRHFIFNFKFFAIVSVVCAHVAEVNPNFSYANVVCGNLLHSFGAIGVSIFFIISGYLFPGIRSTVYDFLKSKVNTLFLPWFFTGSLVYLYVAIRKTGIDLLQWISFVLGIGTYLYFMSMLVMCYLVFSRDSKRYRLFIMGCSLCSIVATSMGQLSFINPYINPFNWFLYFGLGLTIQKEEIIERLVIFSRKHYIAWFVLFFSFIGIILFNNAYLAYWRWYYIPVEVTAVLLISGACTRKEFYDSVIVRFLGSNAFSIYLLHMPVAGLVTFLAGFVDSAIITLIRPLIVLAVTSLFILIYLYFAKVLQLNNKAKIIIGVR